MSALQILSFLLFLIVQDSTEVEFFHNGKFYSFNLPNSNFKETMSKYTEGTFRYFKFENGEVVVLHVGSNIVKPFLVSKKYIVTDHSNSNGVEIRKGYNRKDKLFWQENRLGEEITLYFYNVSKNDLPDFERCLGSLKIKSSVK